MLIYFSYPLSMIFWLSLRVNTRCNICNNQSYRSLQMSRFHLTQRLWQNVTILGDLKKKSIWNKKKVIDRTFNPVFVKARLHHQPCPVMVEALLVLNWHCQSECIPTHPSPAMKRTAQIGIGFHFYKCNTNFMSPVKIHKIQVTSITQEETLSGHDPPPPLVTPGQTRYPVRTCQSMLCLDPPAYAQSGTTASSILRPLNITDLEQSLHFSGESKEYAVPGMSVHVPVPRYNSASSAQKPSAMELDNLSAEFYDATALTKAALNRITVHNGSGLKLEHPDCDPA